MLQIVRLFDEPPDGFDDLIAEASGEGVHYLLAPTAFVPTTNRDQDTGVHWGTLVPELGECASNIEMQEDLDTLALAKMNCTSTKFYAAAENSSGASG